MVAQDESAQEPDKPGAYRLLADLLKAGKPAALATVIGGDRAGAKMLLPGEGPAVGSIHPAVDKQIATDARTLLAEGRNEMRLYKVGGDRLEVFLEVFPPPRRLVIVGAVHVAIPLHRIAKLLGYHVTVVDPRSTLATAERFPEADAILVEWPDDALASLGLDGGSSVVVLTHDSKFDQPALLAALRSPARYIGAIGSRTTNKERTAALKEQGVSDTEISRIHAPIGLDIGAQTPAEIALAIMSEVTAVQYGREGGYLRLR